MDKRINYEVIVPEDGDISKWLAAPTCSKCGGNDNRICICHDGKGEPCNMICTSLNQAVVKKLQVALAVADALDSDDKPAIDK